MVVQKLFFFDEPISRGLEYDQRRITVNFKFINAQVNSRIQTNDAGCYVVVSK